MVRVVPWVAERWRARDRHTAGALERTEQTQTLEHTGLGSQRAGNRYVVHPDDIAASIKAKPSSFTAGKRSG